MIRGVIILLIALSPFLSVYGQDAEECHRPPTQELADYKEAYIPQEFHFESFHWEIADLALLALFLTLASVLSVRHFQRYWFTALVSAALLYFGLIRGGCICPVGATTNFIMGLAAPELIGKLVAVTFLLPLIAAFFFGRVFCSSACPLGALQHLISRKNGIQIPPKINRVLQLIPIILLGFTAWGALHSGIFLACKLDVYKPVFFTGHAWYSQWIDHLDGASVESGMLIIGDLVMWLTLFAVLILGYFVPRPFCRFVCPYSVLLGFFAKIGLRRRHIDAESCFSCVMCTKTCPVQAISANPMKTEVTVSDFHCVQCGRCDATCKSDSFQSPSPFPDSHFPNIGKN